MKSSLQSTPLAEKQERLIALLQNRVRREERLPLSLAQRRLWFLAQLVPGCAFYNMPGSLRIDGEMNVVSLEQGLREVVRRHDTLRTRFLIQDGEPFQIVEKRSDISLDLVDLRGVNPAIQDQVVETLTREEANKSFDLSVAPLLRVRLLWLASDKYIFLMNLHHIITDGWSQGVLIRELSALQSGYQRGQPSVLPELDIQYADYARWQHQWLSGERYRDGLAYWRQQLDGMSTLQLPYDYPRPQAQSFDGAFETSSLEEDLLADLRRTAKFFGTSLFTVLLAGFAVLLHRYSGQNDIVIGSPTANRDSLHAENLIGFFVNMLVLRFDVRGERTVEDTIRLVADICRGAYGHQEFPFEKLVEELQPTRDLSRNPIFQVAFVQLTELGLNNRLGSAMAIAKTLASETSKFDLQVNVQEGPLEGQLLIEYSTALFRHSTIRNFLEHYKRVLRSIAQNPGQMVGSLEVLGDNERQRQVISWNDTTKPYDRSVHLHQLFEHQVHSSPDAIAVICGNRVITYSALNRRSNQLARHLRQQGIGPQNRVGVLLRRTEHMLTALMGILKSGGMYVPLDHGWPAARIGQILQSLNIDTLVSDLGSLDRLKEVQHSCGTLRELILVDGQQRGHACEGVCDLISTGTRVIEENELNALSAEDLPNLSTPRDPAYIIFTSGSTGVPKGVVVSHQAVVNLIEWVTRQFSVGAEDEVLMVASICFDLSVYDIFGLLAVGGRVRIATEEDLEDPDRIADILLSKPVTFWDSAPAALRRVMDFLSGRQVAGSLDLRLAFLSGDWIPVSLPDVTRANFPNVQVVALGGATEAAIWSNWFQIKRVDPTWISIPYGKPIQNARYYILDSDMNPCPVGVKGDLYIGGDCLFTCYENDPILTASKLVPDPFGVDGGERLYRTGDCARFWNDGNIEFLGRADSQVKIRGNRIELGEVEYHLRQLSGIRHCVATVHLLSSGEKQLVAYYVAADDSDTDSEVLKQQLRAVLPEYMIPRRVVRIEEIPLSKNGKVDRDKLAAIMDADDEEIFVDPVGLVEQHVAEVWQSVLNVDRIGRNRNFFDLGGHSLIATKLVARLRERFELNLPLKLLFERPTIAEIAQAIEVALMRDIESLSDDEVQRSLGA